MDLEDSTSAPSMTPTTEFPLLEELLSSTAPSDLLRLQFFEMILQERERQELKFPNQDLSLPVPPFEVLGLPTMEEIRSQCDRAMAEGTVTVGHILLEEVGEFLEAPQENNHDFGEGVQVCAVVLRALEFRAG